MAARMALRGCAAGAPRGRARVRAACPRGREPRKRGTARATRRKRSRDRGGAVRQGCIAARARATRAGRTGRRRRPAKAGAKQLRSKSARRRATAGRDNGSERASADTATSRDAGAPREVRGAGGHRLECSTMATKIAVQLSTCSAVRRRTVNTVRSVRASACAATCASRRCSQPLRRKRSCCAGAAAARATPQSARQHVQKCAKSGGSTACPWLRSEPQISRSTPPLKHHRAHRRSACACALRAGAAAAAACVPDTPQPHRPARGAWHEALPRGGVTSAHGTAPQQLSAVAGVANEARGGASRA